MKDILKKIIGISIFILIISCSRYSKEEFLDYNEYTKDLDSKFSLVNSDIRKINIKYFELKNNLNNLKNEISVKNKNDVKKILEKMVDIDQYVRNEPFSTKYNYNKEERDYFFTKILKLWSDIDKFNTELLKIYIKEWGWFKISIFDKKTEQNAWLLVQHADHDLSFQKNVIVILEKLLKESETSPQNYAYLTDRISIKEKQTQLYGTQGECIGKGVWKPFTIENEIEVDKRRESVGLPSMEIYKKMFENICL